MDYSFMKTGFDLTGNDEHENKKNIVALVSLFGKNALQTSFIYVKHAKRNGVTLEDIKRSTMLEVFLFMKRPNVVEAANTIKEEIFSADSEEEEEEMEEDDEIVDFSESKCECGFCKCINNIYERWEKWEPQGKLEEILKKNMVLFDKS